jgi:predicted TIM-barrel fold metal-dependent hydrolase
MKLPRSRRQVVKETAVAKSTRQITRRAFTGAAALSLLPPARAATLDLSGIPNFCSHEHWGSIDSIGMTPEGFRADVERGAVPHSRTGLLDLLLEPYFRGNLASAGVRADLTRWKQEPVAQTLDQLRRSLDRQRLTGTWQCSRRGILALYGIDLDELTSQSAVKLDEAIARNYSNLFGWYREAMRRAAFSDLVRPVHPEFYWRQDSSQSAEQEAAFTRTVMRIDPLLDLRPVDSSRRKRLAELAGVDPADAKTWRRFLEKLFDHAARLGAVGIKQLQAYRRDLDFATVPDADVPFAGHAGPDQIRLFENWVVNECCRQAHERGWPHQVHVGTHNLTQSSPMPLQSLARRYPGMKIVMIHCWPFLDQAGWLAKYVPNIFIDTCWQPVLSPAFFRRAMESWLTYVPSHKITCGHDSTTVEMAFGSSLLTREILGDALGSLVRDLKVRETAARGVATAFLHGNAAEIYGIGKASTGTG